MPADAALSVRSYGASHGSHSHVHHQVLVGLAGVLDLEVAGRGQRLRAGDALLVPGGELHDFESVRGSRCLVLDSHDVRWARCAELPARPQQVQALAGLLARRLHARDPGAAAGADALLAAWLPAATPAHARRAIDWQVLGAWTQARLQQPLGVADIAAQVHLSTSQFAARCQEAQGMRPAAWLRLQRLVRARQLRDAGLPVAGIARRTGYRSPSALTAALRNAGL
jgi:AraC-like DNA-binding protein